MACLHVVDIHISLLANSKDAIRALIFNGRIPHRLPLLRQQQKPTSESEILP
jgi:hypothetical protein